MSDYDELEDDLEVRISKRSKPRRYWSRSQHPGLNLANDSAMSTYKGTLG